MESKNPRVGVLIGEGGTVQYYVKRRIAVEMLASGTAVLCGPLTIRKIVPRGEKIAISHHASKPSKQDRAIELAGIYSQKNFFQGGLVRHEHQPTKFERNKGAKVGHQ